MSGFPCTHTHTRTRTHTHTVIDLRSDTVTKPTDEMRVAMFEAEVGDDVFCDDPTVIKFETRAAEILGKEAALFVTSGTMGNLLCVLTHCSGRSDEMLLGDDSHISLYEQGGSAFLGGVHSRIVTTLPDGRLDLDDIQRKIFPSDIHFPITKLLCLENTHNRKGGRVLTPEYMDQVADLLKGRGIKIHLDGARLFNAVAALKVPAAKLTERVDSVNVCLSKGLGAPVGSVIAGSKEFIERARRLRKAVGGGWRQAGVIAAPALIALEKGSQRIQEDHDNAQHLAQGLAKMGELGVKIDVSTVETNIVNFDVIREDIKAQDFVQLVGEKGVKLCNLNDTWIRCVTSIQVTREMMDLALEIFRAVLETKTK